MAQTANSTYAPANARFDIDLADLTVNGLLVLYQGHEAAIVSYQGVYNKPRTKDDTNAVLLLDEEMERCADAMQDLATEMQTRRPRNKDEAEIKAELLILWGLRCGSWIDVANSMILEPSH